MSRFADPTATRTVDLGECLCPGSPHESDWVKVRAEVSGVDVRRFSGMGALDDDGVAEGLASFIIEWNLLGSNGQPWPPSAEALMALKLPTVTVIVTELGKVVEESSTLPNASGAPSAGSSRGSASRAQRRSRKPTT